MEYLPLVLLAIVVLIIGMQLRFYFSARQAQGKQAPVFDDLISETQRGKPVLLFYFHSEYCAPCRRLTPRVESLAAASNAAVIIDVAHRPEAAHRFGVRVTPTLMRVSNGLVEKVVVGDVDEERLKKLLE